MEGIDAILQRDFELYTKTNNATKNLGIDDPMVLNDMLFIVSRYHGIFISGLSLTPFVHEKILKEMMEAEK